MNRLHEKGLLTDGNMVEFLRSHTNVVFQPAFDDPRYSGINPYALGFAMMRDIERICTSPQPKTSNGSLLLPALPILWRSCAMCGPTIGTRASSCSSSVRA